MDFSFSEIIVLWSIGSLTVVLFIGRFIKAGYGE